MEESEQREPRTPLEYLVDVLDVNDAENEYELVENKVPEFIFEMLLLRNAQLAEYELLHATAHQDQPTKRHIDHCLEKKRKKNTLDCDK